MVSFIGWLDGLTASGIIISSTIFGLLSFYHAKKLEARLLAYAGLLCFFVGCFFLAPFIDFILLLTTGKNLEPIYLYAYLSYWGTAPAVIIAMYLGSELMWPEKKKIIVSIYAVLGAIFAFFVFFDVNGVFNFTLNNPGEDTIDASFNRAHIAFWLVAIFLASVLIFLGIGFAIKAGQATGELRKKFRYLSIGFFVFVICGALDSILSAGVAIGFVRAVMMTFALWMYLGLKT
jgi:hypothetical protein